MMTMIWYQLEMGGRAQAKEKEGGRQVGEVDAMEWEKDSWDCELLPSFYNNNNRNNDNGERERDAPT